LALRKPEFPLKLDEKCQEFLWANVIAVAEGLSFYELDEPRQELTVFDRSKFVDPTYLIISEQVDHLFFAISLFARNALRQACTFLHVVISLKQILD